MKRRDFLKTAAAAATAPLLPPAFFTAESHADSKAPPADTDDDFHFTEILSGYLRNLERTTPQSFAVCDFPDGTKLKGCLTPSGKTYVSVARMLPAIAEYVAAGRASKSFSFRGGETTLVDLLLNTFRHAFDPVHEHYWGEPVADKPTQRTVESALVAIALHRLGPAFVEKLTPAERTNVNRWLASCTVFPERENNHAWFTATNQAARLELSRSFAEFKGDESWMIADLEAMNALAPAGEDGWYSDSPTLPLFDIYNFWTFGNFPLFWSRIIGHRYEKWDTIFKNRVRQFLEKTPYFFAADGSFPLFGRSLSYRWATLSPLLLGYEMKLWPHSPGLLRRIVRTHFRWWWDLGAYDADRGKLLETLTPDGTPAASDIYVDNGHPYWAMLSYTLFSIPRTDPFWSAPEEPLPVEKDDFTIRLETPRMIVSGMKASGQIRWLQARNISKRETYRDKYTKFVCSSHFPMNVLKEKDYAPWDQAVVFRSSEGRCATRLTVTEGLLVEDGVLTTWTTKLGDQEISITTVVRIAGDFEFRKHRIHERVEEFSGWEILEGSSALPLKKIEEPKITVSGDAIAILNDAGNLVMSWRVGGYQKSEVSTTFDPTGQKRVNILHAGVAVITNCCTVAENGGEWATLYYSSPKPLSADEIRNRASNLLKKWTA